MNKPIDFANGDDLSDLLGTAPRGELPQDDAFARIRENGIGLAPTAKVFTIPCQKCKGRGRFISYAGRDCGPCFTCKGNGSFERKTAPAVLARAKDRRQDAKEAVREAHKDQIAWLDGKLAHADRLPEGYAKMLRDFLIRLNNGQELSGDENSGQLGVIAKGMARDAQYAAERSEKAQERAQAAPQVDASKIAEAIQRGKASGLIWVRLRFDGIRIEEAKKHPGTLYVKAERLNVEGKKTYLGKIAEGRFVASRDCTPADQAAVILICADPLAAAKVYGNVTNRCCVCNLPLTNKESVETGIGPICSGRVGWTPGGLRVAVGA